MFHFISIIWDWHFLFMKERISTGGAAILLYLDPLSPPSLVSPSHGQDSAGLIIPQVEEDVVTKIM